MNQLFQIVPSATGVAVDKLAKASEVTAKGGVYNKAGYFTLDGTGGLYIKEIPTLLASGLPGGLQVEMTVMFPGLPEGDGALVVKEGTMALGISSFKFKQGWVKGFGDTYNASTDQIFGLEQLQSGVKYTLRWSYDAQTGMVVMTVNSRLDRKRYRFQGAGNLNFVTSTWQFFKGVKVNVYSVLVSTGKPNLVAPGMEFYATNGRLELRKVDPALSGALFTTVIESPYGATSNGPAWTIASGKVSDWVMLQLPTDVEGIYTIHASATKGGKLLWQERKLVHSVKPQAAQQKPIVKGIYHVNQNDFETVVGLGATHAYCDFTIQNWEQNWQKWELYLTCARARGLKMFVSGNYQARKLGTFDLVNYDLTLQSRCVEGFYSVDEAAGSFEKNRFNYLAMKMRMPQVPVIVNLNNFTRIEEAAECADILMLNIYLSAGQDTQKITDVVRKASVLKPTHLVLPLYENIQTSTADLIKMARLGIEAGATGIWLFEYDHRSKAKPTDWYIGSKPELMQRVKDVFDSF